jgi:hypothetical protein
MGQCQVRLNPLIFIAHTAHFGLILSYFVTQHICAQFMSNRRSAREVTTGFKPTFHGQSDAMFPQQFKIFFHIECCVQLWDVGTALHYKMKNIFKAALLPL